MLARLLLLTLLALAPPLQALAQTSTAEETLDRVRKQIAANPNEAIETAQARIRNPATPPELSIQLFTLIADAQLQQGQFGEADATAQQAIENYLEQMSPSQHAELLGMRAALPWRQGDLTAALGLMLQAYRLVENGGAPATVARTANRLGVLYSNLGRLDEALNYYQIALELDRTTGAPPANIASTLGNIGLLYHLLDNYAEAARYQSESVALFAEANDPFGRARNQTNLAITRSKLDQPEEAIVVINESLATFEELGDVRGQTSALLGRATIQTTLNRPEETLASIAQVMPLLLAEQATGEIAEAHIIRARALLKLNRLDEALTDANQAAELAAEVGAADAQINAHSLLAEIYEQRGEFAAALDAERTAADSRQEKLDARRRDLIAVLEIEFATAERERVLAELRASHAEQALDLQREQNRLRNAVGGIGVSLLIAAGLLFGYRIKTRHAHELESANTQLADLNAEKSALMDIASHDLRGRLATMRWQAEARLHQSSSLEEAVRNDLTNIADAAGAMHQKVSRLLDSQRAESAGPLGPKESVNLKSWLADRCNSFEAAAAAKSLSFSIDGPDTLNVPIHGEEMAIILDNLIDNALKFSPTGAKVGVNLGSSEGHITIAISDDGPGISAIEQSQLFEKFRTLSAQPTGGESSTGLGLAIVKRLCDRLGIDIKVTSTLGQGATFQLQLVT